MKEDTKKDYLVSISRKTKFQHYPLKEEVIQLLEENNFSKPTLVQAESLPITLQDNLRNLCMIIYAYNGAGKTLTYLIPIFNALENIPCTGQKFQKNKDHEIGRPQAVIIVPTEALLAQIYDYLVAYSDYYEITYKWRLKIGRIYSTVCENGHIIVGMPVKTQVKLKTPSLFDLSELKWVVLDECDMLKQDALSHISDFLKFFSEPKNGISDTNFLITSATGNKQSFRNFIQDNLSSHNIVELDSYDENKGLQGVSHFYSKSTEKDAMIFRILERLTKMETKPQVIIFFNTIPELRLFYSLLRKEKNKFLVNDAHASEMGKNNLKVDYIHRDCSSVCIKGRDHFHPDDCSASKTARITRLKNKQVQVLLGTEAIGRGIDIRTVTLVINYNEPTKNKDMSSIAYIHRVGRTGRYSDQGIALTFISDQIFIKMTENQQKIKFKEMVSEQQVIKMTVQCYNKNERIVQDSEGHRFHQD